MFDVARLRRLDALFAERVMGETVAEQVVVGPLGETMRYLSADANYQNDPFSTVLPFYTRSLDDAWAGAAEHFPIIEISMEPRSIPFHAEVERDGFESMDDADHPAEALVLACLRAVGVEESELQ